MIWLPIALTFVLTFALAVWIGVVLARRMGEPSERRLADGADTR